MTDRERAEAYARAADMLKSLVDAWHEQRAEIAALTAKVAAMEPVVRTLAEMVRLWHGMGMSTVQEQAAWKLYEENAPEWQPIRAILATIPQHHERATQSARHTDTEGAEK